MELKKRDRDKIPADILSIVECVLLTIVFLIGTCTLSSISKKSQKLSIAQVGNFHSLEREEPQKETFSIDKNSTSLIEEVPQKEEIKEDTPQPTVVEEKKSEKVIVEKESPKAVPTPKPAPKEEKKNVQQTTSTKQTAQKQDSKKLPNGAGGYGYYLVTNRSLRTKLPFIAHQVKNDCIVVIDISIDKNGNVTWSNIARATNTKDKRLCNAVWEIAKKVKFNVVKSPQNQAGTITYRFKS